jgi:histone H3/H4
MDDKEPERLDRLLPIANIRSAFPLFIFFTCCWPITQSMIFFANSQTHPTSFAIPHSRIMKKALPPKAKMSKEAKVALQECVSEFIGFITSEASDRLIEDKRKTVTGDDSEFFFPLLSNPD